MLVRTIYATVDPFWQAQNRHLFNIRHSRSMYKGTASLEKAQEVLEFLQS